MIFERRAHLCTETWFSTILSVFLPPFLAFTANLPAAFGHPGSRPSQIKSKQAAEIFDELFAVDSFASAVC